MSVSVSLDPQTTELNDILNDGFFPNVSASRFMATMHIDPDLDGEVISRTLLVAMSRTNRELRTYKANKLECGFPELSDVNDAQINGQNELEFHYEEAVFSYAKAQLSETYADTDTTVIAQAKTDLKEESADRFFRRHIEAVRFIKGKSRSAVKLV